ncbi:LytTR family DNA-binding domain-containing protein [Flavitalea sp. BT771]|uniref:LytR/AlgR family response regulator transcription factor n=1 Tax=Flavitalea sp. BT771 TaxID=3063329 RepID=UPI0026E431ED|nr:LytTR family DNA-binding domain-containing protein [Flavitalea sp. BT771]MDO6431031.1 LytTR family DNA-binding domain-containing protein [Flavitalea sp. BT771]MDV6219938.1 LytTR family DNA-binding domain-containing protein [Flavitalea sp. BT771]
MPLRCLIVDDEPNAVSLLEMFIGQNTSWQLLGKCYNAREALTFIKAHPLDLIFLDINMPQLSGMEMASLLPPDIRIVFTTAYSEYAAESYSFQTIDYLLKPITLRRFYSSLQKIEAHFSMLEGQKQSQTAPAPLIPSREEYFFIKSGRTLSKVLLKDILYFEGEKEYARLVSTQDKILIYKRLKDIEEQLSPSFTRVHNSYIVNVAKVDSIRDNHIFIGGKQIPISEKFRDPFMNIIRERTF